MDLDTHKSTLGACIWMLIGSFLPIVVDSTLRVMLLDFKFFEAFQENIKGGEVFLFTSALITPFFWLLIKSVTTKRSFTLRYFGWVFTFSLVSFFGGLVFFCYFRIGRVLAESNPTISNLFQFNFGYWAIAIYVASLLIWYYSTYYECKPIPDYDNIRLTQQNALKASFNKLKSRS